MAATISGEFVFIVFSIVDEDQIKQFKIAMESHGNLSSELMATQSNNNLKESEYRRNLENLNREYDRKEQALKVAHENEISVFRRQVQELQKKAINYNGQRVLFGTHQGTPTEI